MITALLSLTFIVPAIWLGYTARAWFSARKVWAQLTSDAKAFYLLVAPPITMVLDVVLLADRLFYWPSNHGRRQTSMLIKAFFAASAISLTTYSAIAADGRGQEPIVPSQDIKSRQQISGDRDQTKAYLSPSEATAVQYREPSKDSASRSDAVDSEP